VTQYLALLRGINVGGNNVIKMADLKQVFEQLGFGQVATYIQSGNVLFDVVDASAEYVAARIEEALSRRFSYTGRLVLRSHEQMRTIVEQAPAGFGTRPDAYRYDVLFVRPPLTVAEAMTALRTREGVDQAFAGQGVCYFARLTERATQSYLRLIVGTPTYQNMTIRNWNTSARLKQMMDARSLID
jgi:uncharacterized protein (DUF1697 family)